MGWGFKYQKKKKKSAQIDFLFLEQESEQENCHVWQTAAGWFPWALVFRVSANPISHVCRLALSPPFPFNYFWLIHSPGFKKKKGGEEGRKEREKASLFAQIFRFLMFLS